MTFSARQPFGAVDVFRLQSLSSVKNQQNAISSNFATPFKSTQSSGKRSHSDSTLDDEDSENLDPSAFKSPTKRSKTSNALLKSSPTHFFAIPQSVTPSPPIATSPSLSSTRKVVSSPIATSPASITTSRGSPKHKRVGALSKRRTSSSPFRRIDPPSFSRNSSPSLPFSIDAALSGTIATYTPKPARVSPPETPSLDESMPKSWFFDIHEDTPEQEATNLMEHSACALDISSDDDGNTRRRNEELERGKENIPPPGHFGPIHAAPQDLLSGSVGPAQAVQHHQAEQTKHPKLRTIVQDAMDEDRRPLSDLPAADFYGPGLDATSYVTVDAGIEKPSGLANEVEAEISETPEEPNATNATGHPVLTVEPTEAIIPIPELREESISVDGQGGDSAPMVEQNEETISTVEPTGDALHVIDSISILMDSTATSGVLVDAQEGPQTANEVGPEFLDL